MVAERSYTLMEKEQVVRSRQHRDGVAIKLKRIEASLDDLREAIECLVAKYATQQRNQPRSDACR